MKFNRRSAFRMAAQELEEVIANRESASTTETVLLCDAYADAVAQVIENPSTADGLSMESPSPADGLSFRITSRKRSVRRLNEVEEFILF